jgi:hypothetical protein
MSTTLTTVMVRVDRPAAIRLGYNGTESPIEISIDVNRIPQADRDEIARRLRYADGTDQQYRGIPKGKAFLRGHDRSGDLLMDPIALAKPTVAGLLDSFNDYREIPARLAQEKEAEVKKAIEDAKATLAAAPQVFRRQATLSLGRDGKCVDYRAGGAIGTIDYQYTQQSISEYCLAATPTEYVDLVKARKAMLDEQNKIDREKARDRAYLQLITDHWQPRLDWIGRYGSRDLQRMVSEDLPWADMYDAELADWEHGISEGRLIANRPGWVVVADASEISPPKKPRARAWALLDAARQIEPAAKLGLMGTKYVAYAEYHGQTIIWPAE